VPSDGELSVSVRAFPGVINISGRKAGNLADRRTWTTPTLGKSRSVVLT
jgi:hypothetical protein